MIAALNGLPAFPLARRLGGNPYLAPVAAGLVLLAFTVWLALGLGGTSVTVAVDDVGEGVAALVAAVACAVAASRARIRGRLGWRLLSAAALSWAAGEAAWSYYEVVRGEAVPFPSAADAGFLLAVPLGVAGLLLLPFGPQRAATRTRSVLDGAVIALALLFLAWAFVLEPLYAQASSSTLAQLLGIAYPCGDVVTAAVVLIAASRATGPDRFRFLVLLFGFLANAVADSAFAYLTGAGIYSQRGSVFDAAWVAGFLLIALAALWPNATSWSATEGGQRPWQAALPSIAFAVASAGAVGYAIGGRALGPELTLLLAGLGLLLVTSHLLSITDAAALRRANLEVEARLRRIDAAATVAPPQLAGDLGRPTGLPSYQPVQFRGL